MVIAKVERVDFGDKVLPPQFKITFSSDVPTKPIAGHRFIDLLGKNPYVNRTDLLLDLYGLKFVPKNVYMELGQTLEKYVINYKFPNNTVMRFEYEDYKDCKSGAFNLDEEDIGGLPDGIVVEDNTLIEIKCTTAKFKGFKEEWKLQAQFYAYWWNKKMAKDTGVKVKNIKIIKYYVPKEIINAHLKEPSWIIGKNVSVLVCDLETREISKLIAKARKEKKQLVDDSSIIVDEFGNENLFFQLKKAINKKNLQIEYNKEDLETKKFVSKIYKTKTSVRKQKKKKGLKKI